METAGRVAILGGTFDPIQNAHMELAKVAQEALDASEVWFIPLSTPRHRGIPEATSMDRLEMVNLAISQVQGWRVLDVELVREGPSYSIDTWRDLIRNYPDHEFWWVLGADAARGIAGWNRRDEVLKEIAFLVVDRAGSAPMSEEELKALGFDLRRTRVVHAEIPDISASAVRDALSEQRPILGLVPQEVAEFIESNHLYAPRGDGVHR